MLNRKVDELLNEINRRKVSFLPDNKSYLDYCFEYCCQKLDRLYGPTSYKFSLIEDELIRYIEHDLIYIDAYYQEYGRPLKMYVPPIEYVEEHLKCKRGE
jgi:hypothetical protein